MGEPQKIYTPEFAERISRELGTSISPDQYCLDKSPFAGEASNTVLLTKMQRPSEYYDKINAMDPIRNDYEAAVLLFEALKDISPMLASYAPFWEYLSHVDLYDYMKRRWPKLTDGTLSEEDKRENYVRDHWFYNASNGQWLSGLWWSVKISYKPERTDPYELTKALFRNQDLRVRTGGASSTVFRHKPAAEAIIEFVMKHENDIFKSDFNDKTREMMKFLNRLGGAKEIMFFDKEYFTQLLESRAEFLKNIKAK